MATKKRKKRARVKAGRVARAPSKKKRKKGEKPLAAASRRTAKKGAKKTAKKQARKTVRAPVRKNAKKARTAVSRKPAAKKRVAPPRKLPQNKSETRVRKELAMAFGMAILVRKERIAEERERVARKERKEAHDRLVKVRAEQQIEGFVLAQEFTRRDGSDARFPSFLRHLDNVETLIERLEENGQTSDYIRKDIYAPTRFRDIASEIAHEEGSSLREVYTLFYS